MSDVETYELEKPVWNEGDFSQMEWHDSKIWGISANPTEYEFLIDLDYIFKWVHPKGDGKYFQFWVAPATMVFEFVHDVTLDIQSSQGEIDVASLHMDNPRKTKNGKFIEYTFRFDCHQGEITLNASGYKLYVLQTLRFLHHQNISFTERGGVGFGRELNS